MQVPHAFFCRKHSKKCVPVRFLKNAGSGRNPHLCLFCLLQGIGIGFQHVEEFLLVLVVPPVR